MTRYSKKRTYPDRAGDVKPWEHHTNPSNFGKRGCDERGMGQSNKSPTLLNNWVISTSPWP